MLTRLVVHPPGEYEKWLSDAADCTEQPDPGPTGQSALRSALLRSATRIDGTAGTGPSFKGIYGRPVQLEGMAPVMVEDNYIRESILDPTPRSSRAIRPQMPTFKGMLSDKDITALIEFIKSRK